MMTRDEAIACLAQWFDDNCVGNITFFRSPRANHADAVVEETIKLREFSRPDREAVEAVFDAFESEKMEFYRDREGYPDRIKVIRRP
jgi:hypothetical protein